MHRQATASLDLLAAHSLGRASACPSACRSQSPQSARCMHSGAGRAGPASRRHAAPAERGSDRRTAETGEGGGRGESDRGTAFPLHLGGLACVCAMARAPSWLACLYFLLPFFSEGIAASLCYVGGLALLSSPDCSLTYSEWRLCPGKVVMVVILALRRGAGCGGAASCRCPLQTGRKQQAISMHARITSYYAEHRETRRAVCEPMSSFF